MTVTAKQIQLIHIAKYKLGMDDDTYRDVLNTYGVASSKALTFRQANKLIDELKKKGFKMPRKRNNRPKKADKSSATIYQINLIEFLADQYPWRLENGFDLWLTKQVDRGKLDLRNNEIIFSEDASYIIERLKQMTGISTQDISSTIQPFFEWKKENPKGTFNDYKNSCK
ncbi:MAG: phage protein GemA/Gp16 family protein [Deferribacterales bacterium]